MTQIQIQFCQIFLRRNHLNHHTTIILKGDDEEKSDKIGSESVSSSKLGTVLGGLLRGVELSLGVTLYADGLFNCDGGSLTLP